MLFCNLFMDRHSHNVKIWDTNYESRYWHNYGSDVSAPPSYTCSWPTGKFIHVAYGVCSLQCSVARLRCVLHNVSPVNNRSIRGNSDIRLIPIMYNTTYMTQNVGPNSCFSRVQFDIVIIIIYHYHYVFIERHKCFKYHYSTVHSQRNKEV